MDQYLQEDDFFKVSSPEIIQFVEDAIGSSILTKKQAAIRLYYAVRDLIYYNPFRIHLDESKNHSVVDVLDCSEGHCIDKAAVLISCLRSIGVPARLGLARVRNHFGTSKLEKLLRTDVLVPHGYTEVFLDDTWVKCTPAFNKELCEKLGVSPLDWNGEEDSIFQDSDRTTSSMEYLEALGSYASLPEDKIKEWMKKEYPHLFTSEGSWVGID